jgi:hypothetical protein
MKNKIKIGIRTKMILTLALNKSKEKESKESQTMIKKRSWNLPSRKNKLLIRNPANTESMPIKKIKRKL